MLGRDLTLTDRKLIWVDLLAFNTNPIWGTGYGSFWTGIRVNQMVERWRTSVTHSGYLDIYLNLGWIGVAMLLSVIVHSYQKYLRSTNVNFTYAKFNLSFLIVTLIYNYAEKGFTGTSFVWFTFLLVYLCPVNHNLKRKDDAR